MSVDIKILFVSDIHLGIKNEGIQIPDYSRVNTFRRIAAIARNHDLFLIGGDLIDGPSVGPDVIEIIKDEFRGIRNAGTEILYTPGGAEMAGGGIPPVLLDFNVSALFTGSAEPKPHLFMKEDQKLYVYGMPASSDCDISGIRKIADDGFHIGLFHVDFDFENGRTGAQVQRLQKHDIRSLGLDFYAFGSSHNFKMFKILDRIIGVCPGSPESTSFGETGDRYAISIVINDNRLFQIKRLTVNSMRLFRNSIDCSGLVTMGPIKELLENNKSKKAIQRLVLTGERNFVLRQYELQKYKNEFFRLDIIDESLPTIDSLIEEFQYENSLRGEFYKLLKEHLQGGALPDVDPRDLSVSLNRITKDGFTDLEGWLCSL